MHQSKIPFALISALPYIFPGLGAAFSKIPPFPFLFHFLVQSTTKTLMQKGKILKPFNNLKRSPSPNNTWLLNSLLPSIVVNYFTKEGSGIVPCTDGEI